MVTHNKGKLMKTKKIAAANNFRSRLFGKLVGNGNLFLGNASVDIALGMVKTGSRGDTNAALADVLGSPEKQEDANVYYRKMVSSVAGDDNCTLVTANALWTDSDYRVRQEFVKSIANVFKGSCDSLDFKNPDAAVRVINAWSESNTAGKIPSLVDVNSFTGETKVVLTNAVYFKGSWENKFDPAKTSEGDFNAEGGAVKTPFMRRVGNYGYASGDGFEAVSIPYQGGMEMCVVMPPAGELPSLASRVPGNLVGEVLESLAKRNLYLCVPKFTLSSDLKLSKTLVDMGAGIAFSDGADFSGMGDEKVKVSEVIHKTFVDVNEEGTEAAAATAVTMRGFSVSVPKTFCADRPFLFFIVKGGDILFSGVLSEF
jgi:serpin B